MRRERRCYTCPAKECNPPFKVPMRWFVTPEDPPDFVPRCEKHGKMVRVPNVGYMKAGVDPEQKEIGRGQRDAANKHR